MTQTCPNGKFQPTWTCQTTETQMDQRSDKNNAWSSQESLFKREILHRCAKWTLVQYPWKCIARRTALKRIFGGTQSFTSPFMNSNWRVMFKYADTSPAQTHKHAVIWTSGCMSEFGGTEWLQSSHDAWVSTHRTKSTFQITSESTFRSDTDQRQLKKSISPFSLKEQFTKKPNKIVSSSSHPEVFQTYTNFLCYAEHNSFGAP